MFDIMKVPMLHARSMHLVLSNRSIREVASPHDVVYLAASKTKRIKTNRNRVIYSKASNRNQILNQLIRHKNVV